MYACMLYKCIHLGMFIVRQSESLCICMNVFMYVHMHVL